MPVVYTIFSLEVYKRHGKTKFPVSLELSIKEAKAAWVLFLFLLAAMKKKTIIVSFWKDSSVLTATYTACAVIVCKAGTKLHRINEPN